jgi:ribonucleoside-diphosphate reductase alpha chain
VFRALAFDYLGRTDLVHVLNKPEVGNTDDDTSELSYLGKPELSNMRVVAPTSSSPASTTVSKNATAVSKTLSSSDLDMVNAAAKNMQSDAPACNTCGHITVRSGTCYKCLNCGNSMGCS